MIDRYLYIYLFVYLFLKMDLQWLPHFHDSARRFKSAKCYIFSSDDASFGLICSCAQSVLFS